jgi:hypothetical protein
MASDMNINFNPKAMTTMLQNAASGEGTMLGENAKEVLLSRADLKKDKAERAKQLEEMMKAGTDNIQEGEGALRLANQTRAAPKMQLSTDPNSCTQQMIASPTSFLTGGAPASPRLQSFAQNQNSIST